MLTSLGLILLIGYFLGLAFEKIKLPSLLGMLLTGIIIGPFALNLLDENILIISSDLRELALIIILTRAGLNLDLKDLKAVGRPAILLCFVPAILEIVAIVLVAPLLFGISTLDAAIMGTVVAAVSPAVVVPRMLKLMEKGLGKDKSIPQMIMAGASVDDILVIILFFTFIKMATGGDVSSLSFIKIPLNIIFGIGIGILSGWLLNSFFKKTHMRDTSKVIVMLGVSILLVALEDVAESYFPFSALLSVMFIGITLLKQNQNLATRLSAKFSKLWVAAEIILFVLVGAAVNLSVLKTVSIAGIILVFAGLAFRMLGVNLSVAKTHFNFKERLFCMVAYSPKATVQAAIGTIPLTMGLASGNIILSIAVLSIILTAPLGAILIDYMSKFLNKEIVK